MDDQRKTELKEDVEHKIERNVENQEEKKLEEAINKRKKSIFKVKTLFPLDLFPDTLTIDLDTVTVSSHNFIKSGSVVSYSIDDIKRVVVEKGPITSTVRIYLTGASKEVAVSQMKNSDAFEVRKIINGLLRAKKEHINLRKIDTKMFHKKIEELGAF